MPAPPVDDMALDWQQWALCADVDPELWFPEKADSKRYEIAKEICADCPVRQECLQYALDVERQRGRLAMSDLHGMFGGCTPAERYRLHLAWRKERGDRSTLPIGLRGVNDDAA